MEGFESGIFSEKPKHVDVTIIDTMFFLCLWKDLPAIFGTNIHIIYINNIHLVYEKVV